MQGNMTRKSQAGQMIRRGIFFCLMAVFYLAAVRCNHAVQQTARIVTVALKGDPVPAKAAAEICARESEGEQPLTLCFWEERHDVRFECRETGAAVTGTALLTEGAPELIVPGSVFSFGQENGCLTDEETAGTLFGSVSASGQPLHFGERAYTVCGTFEGLRPTVILNGDSADAAFTMLSVRVPDGGSVSAKLEQLLIRHGLSGEIMDFTFPAALSADLVLLLPCLLAAALIRLLWSAGRSSSLPAAAVCMFLIVAVAAVSLRLLASHLVIPADMIPSRWSDFSFWSGLWRTQRQNLLRILAGAQGEMQLEMLWNFCLSALCSILAAACGHSAFIFG